MKVARSKMTTNYSIVAKRDNLACRPNIFTCNAEEIKKKYNRMGNFDNIDTLVMRPLKRPISVAFPSMSNGEEKQNKVATNGALSPSRPQKLIDAYKLIHRKGFIFHVKTGFRFKIYGHVKLSILFGSVHIHGHILNSTTRKSIQIFASHTGEAYVVETYFDENSNDRGMEEKLKRDNIIVENSKKLLKLISKGDALLLVEEVALPPYYNCQSYLSSNELPCFEADTSIFPAVSRMIPCIVTEMENPRYQPMIVSPEWEDLPLNGRTVIVGGKGVGKSNLGKYLANKMLNFHKSVLWLELDIGQGEFIPPGSVGFSIITEPIFGPNYSQIYPPERMIHLGEVNIDPFACGYEKIVSNLVETCELKYKNIPWIVNTMGYSKGLGLYINKATIHAIKPNQVIQIESEFQRINIAKPLIPERVNEIEDQDINSNDMSSVDYNFISVKSVVSDHSNIQPFGNKPKDARNRMLISYLGQMLKSPYYSFNAVHPYCIPLADLKIVSTSIRDNLKALNGSLVSLEHIDNKNASETCLHDSGLLHCPEAPIYNKRTLGLGIVRGINTIKRELYLITPLPPILLCEVNAIQISSVAVPKNIFINQEGVEGEVPYTTRTADKNAASTIKRLFISPKSVELSL